MSCGGPFSFGFLHAIMNTNLRCWYLLLVSTFVEYLTFPTEYLSVCCYWNLIIEHATPIKQKICFMGTVGRFGWICLPYSIWNLWGFLCVVYFNQHLCYILFACCVVLKTGLYQPCFCPMLNSFLLCSILKVE